MNLFESTFDVQSSAFDSNGQRGMYFQYSSDGSFIGNTVRYNGYAESETGLMGGLVFYESSPAVEDNRITQNYFSGLLSMNGSFPIASTNLISENGDGETQLPEESEIYALDYALPVLAEGHNDIYDTEGGYYVYTTGEQPMELPNIT
jgi:parallel beta-helix repeat protein